MFRFRRSGTCFRERHPRSIGPVAWQLGAAGPANFNGLPAIDRATATRQVKHLNFRPDQGPLTVAKPELGTKRLCGNCGAKFYDLSKDPIVCPKCHTVMAPAAISARSRPEPVAA